jgi:hypothetical protein
VYLISGQIQDVDPTLPGGRSGLKKDRDVQGAKHAKDRGESLGVIQ